MANVANTIATGPASKDAISGGKKFPLKSVDGASTRGGMARLGTSSDEAHRKIMSLKINQGTFGRGHDESIFLSHKAPRGRA